MITIYQSLLRLTKKSGISRFKLIGHEATVGVKAKLWKRAKKYQYNKMLSDGKTTQVEFYKTGS